MTSFFEPWDTERSLNNERHKRQVRQANDDAEEERKKKDKDKDKDNDKDT